MTFDFILTVAAWCFAFFALGFLILWSFALDRSDYVGSMIHGLAGFFLARAAFCGVGALIFFFFATYT